MSKKATAKTIPREILDLVRQEFNNSQFLAMSRGTGKWSFIPHLQKAVVQFIENEKERYPDLLIHYPKGPTEDLLRRAFNLKSPPGATRSLRDLLSLYSTQGKYDWNTLIREQFPEKLSAFLDDGKSEEHETNHLRNGKSGIDIFASRIVDLLAEKLSSREIELVRKQILDETSVQSPTKLLENILVSAVNDPEKPEFPPRPFYTPKFPASNTYPIRVPGFSHVYLKDESTNPTGTHKDRMAWEVLIKAKRYHVKEISIISSGSAAMAIQHLFNLYDAQTTLKVLVDVQLNPEIKQQLRQIGCKVYETDLSQRPLSSKQIRELTENVNGIDITYREVLDRYNDNYYDWLSYEILNESPSYCFIPFGTGDLFINVLIIAEREFNNRIYKHDPRFRGNIEKICKCHFIGATTHQSHSRLDKLFSYHLPSLRDYQDYLNSLIDNQRIGTGSAILDIEEEFIEEAMSLAATQHIVCEPSGIAGLALLLQSKGDIPKDENILIVNTGKTNYKPIV